MLYIKACQILSAVGRQPIFKTESVLKFELGSTRLHSLEFLSSFYSSVHIDADVDCLESIDVALSEMFAQAVRMAKLLPEKIVKLFEVVP